MSRMTMTRGTHKIGVPAADELRLECRRDQSTPTRAERDETHTALLIEP